MHSAVIAEWIVGRFTAKERAASIVGDLLELEPQSGRWWFWLSLARIVTSLAWRPSVAFLAALCAYATALSGTFLTAMLRRPVHPYPWRNAWAILFLAGSFLWFIFVYAAIRGGVRDRLAQLALALAGLITAMVYCWWQPAVLAVCAILSICLVSASVVSREQRRAALVLLVVMMAGFGGLVLTLGLPALYQHLDFAGPMGDAEMQKHPAALSTAFCMLFLMTPSVMTIAFSRMQNWLRRNSPPDMETSRQSLS